MARSERPSGPTGLAETPPTATEPAPAASARDDTLSLEEVESTVPSGREGVPAIPWRRNLYAIAAAQLLAIIGFSLRAPFLPFFIGDLGVRTAQDQALWAGLINAAGAGTMAISAPIWGIVADRRGRRPMLLRATFAATATVGLMGLATQPWNLLVLRLIEGSLSGTVTASTALVATTSPKARLGYTLGIVQTAVFAGSSLGPLIGGALAHVIGPRATFAVASACLAGAGLIVLFLVRENFVPAPAPSGPRGSRLSRIRGSVAALVGGTMVTLVLVLFVVRFASMGVQPIIPLFIAELAPQMSDPSVLAGLAMGALGFTSAASAMFFGRLGDRRGHWPILLGCIAAAGLLYFPMAFAQDPWQLVVLQGLFGFTAGGLIPSANALIATITPAHRRGAMYGLTAGAGSLGGFVGPLVGASVAAFTSFRAPFLVTGVLLLLLTIPVIRAMRRPQPIPE